MLADIVLLRRDASAYRPLNDVVNQIVFCENGSNVDMVIVDGEIVVNGGRLTKVDEDEVLRLAEIARARLEPSMQSQLSAAKTMEPALAQMYFRVFGK
jgi:5-methylthioadenosine/S-adenosylhomocysteine deaminase